MSSEPADSAAQIAIIGEEVRAAADAIIASAARGLDLMPTARAGDAQALDGLEQSLVAILEACAFQDLTGQRLERLSPAHIAARAASDPLLNGTADPGEGLDQAAADRLLSET